RSVVGIAWIVVPLAIASLHGFYIATARNVRFGPHAILLSVPICTAIGATSGLAGPLFLTPLWALAFAVVATALHGLGRYRIPMIALACCAVLVPALAEWIGLMPSPYVFHEDGSLTILPRLVELPESRVRPSLLAATIASIVLVCVLLWRFG